MFKSYENTVSCKIGTIPAVVIVHKSDIKNIKPDNWIRIKEREGGNWVEVYDVTRHTARDLITGATYSHLPFLSKLSNKTGRKAKYNVKDFEYWQKLRDAGYTTVEIAQKTGIHRTTISRNTHA